MTKKQIGKNPFHVKEQVLMNWCIEYLNYRGHHVQRINAGKAFNRVNGKIVGVIKLAETGTPDIIGYSKTGQFIGIEVKIKPNKPEPEQIAFIEEAKRRGCIAEIVYSQEELMRIPNL